MNETVEVPVMWLKKLMVLGKNTDVHYVQGQVVGKADLYRLKGYIQSAEALLAQLKNQEESKK